MKPDDELLQTAARQPRFSPFDYVDGISLAGDRALQARHLLRAMDEALDLRFVHHGHAGAQTAVFAAILPWDSAFFGYRVARIDAVQALVDESAAGEWDSVSGAIAALVDRARSRGVRYLFAPIDARDLAAARALGRCGFSLIETRLHFHRELRGYAPAERHQVREAVPADLDLLERTAREMVNPFDRFHADPFIPREDADRLMTRWIRESVLGGFSDETWVPDDPAPEGFCTTKLHDQSWTTWKLRLVQPVVLGAVAPRFKGWYRRLISEICVRLAERGAEHAFFVTQVANRAAIRSVEKLAFRVGRGELVFRILL